MNISWAQCMALCRKEWHVVMDTPLGYVMAVAFLIVSGFFFESNLFLIAQADMRSWFSVVSLLLMFFIPAMSMRMLADEKRDGTFELLATMPVTTASIVLGKYIALWMQIVLLLVLTFLYPLTLSWLGNIDAGQIAASYLGLVLLVSSYAAICLYASAVTRYEVVAYVLGFVLLLLFFLLSKSIATFPPAVQGWLVLLSPVAHYESMLRGLIHLSDIIFFLVLTWVFLTFTWFELERRRWR